jgi:hypothetical protein
MKYNIKLFSLGCILLGMTGCSDSFLDTSSKSSQTDDNFYRTVSDAQLALNGCYDGYQVAYCYNGANFQVASELMSDNCFAGGGTADDTNFQAIDRFDKSYTQSNNIFEAQWQYYYSAINRCNMLLSKEEQINWGSTESDEQVHKNIIGQCRALRALCYFDLTRMFGSVPLLTEPSVNKSKEAEPSAIYAQIAQDLKYAADNIKLGAYNASSWKTQNNGLISEWAAGALLARVYLFYTGYYGASDLAGVVTKDEVKTELVNIITNGGFNLLSDYSSLWPCASRKSSSNSYTWAVDNYAGESNQEVLFNLKFDSNSDQGTNQNGAIPLISMRNTKYSPYGTGWGVCTVNSKLYMAYSSIDKRRDASIINIDGEGVSKSANFNTAKDWREYTGYSIKKYSALCYYDGTDNVKIENPAADFQYNQGQDFIVMRYADVLLMAAELGCADAQTYFNKVRTRAGLTDSKTATVENILEERRLEFAFEGLRYWDLLRQGVSTAAKVLVNNQNNISVQNGGVAATVTVSENNIVAKKGLLQKPTNQITLMGSEYLSQNSGW